MTSRRPARPSARPVHRRRAAALAVLTAAVTAGGLAAAGPATAIPFEGDPDAGHCVRLVSWTELTGEPIKLPPDHSWVSVPLIAVLVPLADC
jgi:hypothetical protein